jgi:putative nucleotidyltransferase with HDIG domain
MSPRRPPALLARTLAVTFTMAAALVGGIFGVILISVSDQVRQTVRRHLESSQRMFAAVEERSQREQRLQAANAAESPTLKAAMDTYAAEFARADASVRDQLLNTVTNELAKVAARVEADAVVVTDTRQKVIAASGPFGNRWRSGATTTMADTGVVHVGEELFRLVSVPLVVSDDVPIGALSLATSLDRGYAQQLATLADSHTAIVSRGTLVASTLEDGVTSRLAAMVGSLSSEGTLELGGESHAFRRIFSADDTAFYSLASVDESSRAAIRSMTRTLAFIALGAMCVALLGSIWLAKMLSEPIGRLSASLHRMAASRTFDQPLPSTGSSQELDRLTATFNDLMSSVAAAEAETEEAYTAAIRALAATLDARDPYTAGHSERVSALSVAMGRSMGLTADELEVVRLGALLHDIGKIGVPDEILRKVGPLTDQEFDVIKEHPGLGARILRTVPFLSPHIPIVELHHERPDGRGYPHGLKSDQIPLAAHIVHVADAFDAMTSARAYRPGRAARVAVAELWSGAGTEFQPDAVAALTAVLPAEDVAVAESHKEAYVA